MSASPFVADPGRRLIPTRYNGVRFRSKLEADWALCFDRLGMTWEYEKEGLQLEHAFYLPDFYLPRSRQYVECKVEPTPEDVRKWLDLLAHVAPRPHTNRATCPDAPLIIANPRGAFFGYLRTAERVTSFEAFVLERAVRVALFQCATCGGAWFGVEEWSWRCQCCGAYDGRGHLRDVWCSPIEGFPRPESWAG